MKLESAIFFFFSLPEFQSLGFAFPSFGYKRKNKRKRKKKKKGKRAVYYERNAYKKIKELENILLLLYYKYFT